MKKPITVCTSGLGHPEGPYELDDGRVIYANSYASEIGVWDPKTGKAGTYAKVGGGAQRLHAGERRLRLFHPDPQCRQPGSRPSIVRHRSRRPALPARSRSW